MYGAELSGNNVFNHITPEKEIVQKENGSQSVFLVIYRRPSVTMTVLLQKHSAHLSWACSSAWCPFLCYTISSSCNYVQNNFILQMRKQGLKPSDWSKVVLLTLTPVCLPACLPSTKLQFTELKFPSKTLRDLKSGLCSQTTVESKSHRMCQHMAETWRSWRSRLFLSSVSNLS